MKDKRASQHADSANTVVISKQYLDELLRMSVMRDDVKVGSNVMRDSVKVGSNVTHEDIRVPVINDVTHVNLDPTQVPELEANTSSHHQPVVTQSPPKPHNSSINHQGPPPGHQTTPHGNQGKEQWLYDLAIQAKEQRERRESEKLRQKQNSPEDYFPFGRPGGGAPITSETGQVLTNYRHRGQMGGASNKHISSDYSSVETTVAVRNNITQANITSPHHSSHYQSNVPTNGPPESTNQIPIGGTGLLLHNIGESPSRGQNNTQYSTTPRFARGAGPFVDQYALQEKEEKRKKQMEHMV